MKMVWKKSDKKRAAPIKPPLQISPSIRQTKAAIAPLLPLPRRASKTKSRNPNLTSRDSQNPSNQKATSSRRYHEALTKWEAALTLMPERAILHEQKAQVLLEIGEAWKALEAARRATELEPLWAEAWVSLGRAQLNFGEPEASIESFDKALSIKPDLGEPESDRQTALHLVKKRKRLQIAGSDVVGHRYTVKDKDEIQVAPLGD